MRADLGNMMDFMVGGYRFSCKGHAVHQTGLLVAAGIGMAERQRSFEWLFHLGMPCAELLAIWHDRVVCPQVLRSLDGMFLKG